MMSRKKVIIISLGWEQEPMIDKIGALDWDIYGVHYNQDYYKGVEYKDMLVTDIRNIDQLLAYADKIQPDAVISDQCDYSHFAQAVIAQKFNLPGPSVMDAQISANKYLQRQTAAVNNVKVPRFAMVATIEEINNFADEVGLPIIIKPVDNRGSFGVHKISSKQEIEQHFYDTLANSHSRLMIAEQFIEGTEITIDGYYFRGNGPKSLALAKKGKVDGKRQVSVDIKYPGEIDPTVYPQALANNEFVAKQLGYGFGMLHAEYMVTEQGEVYLVEMANRGGGVYTSEIIAPSVSGIDILSAYVNDCLGIEYNMPSLEQIAQNNVILKFFSFEPGHIQAIEGIDELDNEPNLLKFRLAVAAGDVISPITTDANRHGFVIVKSDGDVREEAARLINKIKIVYK